MILVQDLTKLFKHYRLNNYRKLFSRIREKDGSLSATEAFAADVIYLLEEPTITQLAETLGISQPNATYKVNNLAAKGYVRKTVSEDDRRECRLQVVNKFYSYYDTDEAFITQTVEKLSERFTSQELDTFRRVLEALDETVEEQCRKD